MFQQSIIQHFAEHAEGGRTSPLPMAGRDMIRIGSRRWFLQTGLTGLGSLSLANLPGRAAANEAPTTAFSNPTSNSKKSVILFWLSGGPSHIDTWDPKPDAAAEIRGPFSTIETKVPGVRLCEHLPLQASITDKFSILRAVDCRSSNHTPITMQAGNPLARRTDDSKDGGGYPSMGSVVAKYRGPNHPDLPAFVGLAPSWKADVWEAGHMGGAYAPVKGLELIGKFGLPEGIQLDRLQNRNALRQEFDRMRRDIDRSSVLPQIDQYNRQAYEMVASGEVQRAFDVGAEKNETRDAYGRNSIGEKALLARRLVEAGVSFVLVSGAWGYFDTHGDSFPPWGGIVSGLKPLLPQVDRVLHALITDLEQRGLLDSTLVLMMGEFGRTPAMTAEGGRHHWVNAMSMLVAGGGLRHGQAVGNTDAKGQELKEGIVRPQDLAATVYKHMGVDLTTHWMSPQGRPTPVVVEGGRPIPELG